MAGVLYFTGIIASFSGEALISISPSYDNISVRRRKPARLSETIGLIHGRLMATMRQLHHDHAKSK